MARPGELIRADAESRALDVAGRGAPYPSLTEQSPFGTSTSPIAETYRILRGRYWVLILSVVVVTTLAGIQCFREAKVYDAAARIAVLREAPVSLRLDKDSDSQDPSGGEDYDYSIALSTQASFLQSDAVALDVMTRLGLLKNRPNPADGALVAPRVDDKHETALLDWFRGSLRVTTVPRTRILEIKFSHNDPKMAAQIVNTLINVYIERNIRAKYESTTQTSEFLSKQLSDLQSKMETSEEKLVAFQKEKGIIGIDEKQNIITSKLNALNTELSGAENDRIQKESLYRMVKSQDVGALAKFSGDTTVDKLRTQELDLKMQLTQANVMYGPAHPKVKELQSRLNDIDTAIKAQFDHIGGRIQADYLAAVQREKMLNAALEEQKKEANQLNQNAIEYNVLKHEADSYRQLYENILQRLKEASITAGLRSTNLRIVDYARVPTVPSKPNIPRTMELALLMGLAGGLGLVFLLEQLDNTLRTHEQIELVAGVPALAVVPANRSELNKWAPKKALATAAGAKNPSLTAGPIELVSHSRPRSDVAEAYRALRTSIMLSTMGGPPRVILATSAMPQEGKTTTSINTAIVLAQKGLRVLLIDADMRRPTIARSFGLKSSYGLSSVLTGQASLEQSLAAVASVPGLSILPAGPPPPYPSELLGSTAMMELLTQVRTMFDHVVIDTPPVLSVTDAVLLAVQADAVLIVVRANKTTKQALRRTRELLGRVNTRITGVVLNAVERQSAEHYYYYGGKYSNHYTYFDDQPK